MDAESQAAFRGDIRCRCQAIDQSAAADRHEVSSGRGLTMILGRAQRRRGRPAAAPERIAVIGRVGPRVGARDRQVEVAEDTGAPRAASSPGTSTVSTPRNPASAMARRVGTSRPIPAPPKRVRVAERVELDGEWEGSGCCAQPRPCNMPPTCSSSFQATSASLFTNARKSQNVMTSVRRSVVAVTVAVRVRSLMSATSPK